MPTERLDKLIASLCSVSRRDAAAIIKSGRVEVNGEKLIDRNKRVDVEANVTVDGEVKAYKKFVYIMLNKPKGILSASNDKTRPTVVNIVEKDYKRCGLFPVGRLDKDTTGLLIITDDGDFGHKVISPKNYIEKEYIAEVDKPVTEDDIKTLSLGVTLADGTKCRPAKVVPVSSDCKMVSVTITEGKYHEIKRILGTVGVGVNSLKRVRIGKLMLDQTLSCGDYRELELSELEKVFE